MKSDFWPPYKRDVERIIHSKAFRRYTDKTQVVYLVENDHVTHRSLHVQLVSSFARGLAEMLGLNMHLVEAIALGHDVGHPPFGHEGEGYLSELTTSLGLGAFSHAHQSCRLFSEIEPLELSFEVYDGFLCHDGGMRQNRAEPKRAKTQEDHEKECQERRVTPEKDFQPATLEGALVKMCDTISYLGKDIEDAIQLGLIRREEIPETCLGRTNNEILERAGRDLIEQSHGKGYIQLSDGLFQALKELRRFNFGQIYTDPRLKVESEKIRTAYHYLYEAVEADFLKKGQESILWNEFLHSKTEKYRESHKREQQIVDYIAGMTDNYFMAKLKSVLIPQKIVL